MSASNRLLSVSDVFKYVANTQRKTLPMAFADPTSVTINAVSKSLARVTQDGRTGVFELASDGLVLKVSHVIKKRASRMVRLDRTVTRADALTGLNTPVTDSIWIVYNAPTGLTVPISEQKYMLNALADFIKVAGNQDKFLNGES